MQGSVRVPVPQRKAWVPAIFAVLVVVLGSLLTLASPGSALKPASISESPGAIGALPLGNRAVAVGAPVAGVRATPVPGGDVRRPSASQVPPYVADTLTLRNDTLEVGNPAAGPLRFITLK